MDKKKMPQVSTDEIDLLDLAAYYLRRWYLLLLCFLLGASAYGAYTWLQKDTFTSKASLFIQTETTSITSLADVQLGNALSADFIELAQSMAVLDTAIAEVEEDTGIELTREDLLENVAITNTNDTRLLVFAATTDNPLLSRAMAEDLADATAQQVSVIMNAEEPKFVDHAEIKEANSKHLLRNIFLGGMIGVILVCGILTMIYLMDDMVVTENDLKKYFDVNVIGTVSLDRSKTFKKRKK